MVASKSGSSQANVSTSQKLQSSGYDFNVSLSKTAANNANLLEKGQSINAARNSATSVASSVAALSNQTGGNIMGFTYE